MYMYDDAKQNMYIHQPTSAPSSAMTERPTTHLDHKLSQSHAVPPAGILSSQSLWRLCEEEHIWSRPMYIIANKQNHRNPRSKIRKTNQQRRTEVTAIIMSKKPNTQVCSRDATELADKFASVSDEALSHALCILLAASAPIYVASVHGQCKRVSGSQSVQSWGPALTLTTVVCLVCWLTVPNLTMLSLVAFPCKKAAILPQVQLVWRTGIRIRTLHANIHTCIQNDTTYIKMIPAGAEFLSSISVPMLT